VASCAAALAGGLTRSGTVWITAGGNTYETYCEQAQNGGGWTLVYNSVIGVDTLNFWQIPYAQRLQRFGRPSLDSNYYDGALYTVAPAMQYMDVFEDQRGKVAVAFVASSAGFNSAAMTFVTPTLLSGNASVFGSQFAGGWSSSDFDNDSAGGSNCAASYLGVAQHYSNCWNYNLGSDADGTYVDGGVGPHVAAGTLSALGLSSDGTGYSRVRRITRYAKW
jgi:hypothetical protein